MNTSSIEKTNNLPSSIENNVQKAENEVMERSHLKKSLDKKSRRSLLITCFGILLFLVITILFGQSILVNFSILLGMGKNSPNLTDSGNTDTGIVIPPPELDILPDATNSAKIDINGNVYTDEKIQVKLFLQDELIDITEVDKDDSFTFKDVELKEGTNKLKAVAVLKGETSENSNILNIDYLKNNPSLIIEYPTDGASLSGGNTALNIKGKTDSGNTITINDYTAIIKNDGSFTYDLTLTNGENKIKVISTDKAGNKTEKEVKVNYSP